MFSDFYLCWNEHVRYWEFDIRLDQAQLRTAYYAQKGNLVVRWTRSVCDQLKLNVDGAFCYSSY